MAKAATKGQATHTEVVIELSKNLPKLGIKCIRGLAEVRLRLGQDLDYRMDFVAIAGNRTRAGKKGPVVALFEVKTEQSQLFRVVMQGLQQLKVYELGLANPTLYVVGEERQDCLRHSLAYRKYLVIPKILWDELDGLSDDDVERLSEILMMWNVGIVTFDTKWKFRMDGFFGEPRQEETPYLGKAVKRKKAEQVEREP